MEAIRTKLQQPANPSGLQFIILSHDSALEKYFDKQNGTTDWTHQKLQGMPPVGRVMISAQEADRLKCRRRIFSMWGKSSSVRHSCGSILSTSLGKSSPDCRYRSRLTM